ESPAWLTGPYIRVPVMAWQGMKFLSNGKEKMKFPQLYHSGKKRKNFPILRWRCVQLPARPVSVPIF
ncbi:MAG: hypothetical protein VX079_00125, partial [Pseudomonadota bacterium]|nr:hypothetical protein [Pseudomonadota bacterium]